MSLKNRKNERQTKGERTKEVRRVLLRHQVDLTKVYFTANPRSIYFSGELIKASGHEITNSEMICLVEELNQLGMIRSDLENWSISSDSVRFLKHYSNDLPEDSEDPV